MKKFRLLGLIAVTMYWCSLSMSVNAQSYFNKYDINEDFEKIDISVDKWGLSGNFASTAQVVTTNREAATFGKVLDTYGGSASGTVSGSKDLGTLTTDGEGRLWLDFDWMVNNGQNLYNTGNGGYVYFRDADGKLILGFNIGRGGGDGGNNLHVLNLDNTVVNDPENAATLITPTNETGNFSRTNQWVNIHAVLNFTTKTIDTLRISSRTSGNGAVYEYDDQEGTNKLAFYDETAGLLKNFELQFYRVGSGANRWRPQFDNFKIYHLKESLGVADVTVRFKDQNGDYFKADSIFSDLQIGEPFAIPDDLLITDKINDYYYILNPESPIQIENVEGNTTLTLLFEKLTIANVTLRYQDQDGVFFMPDSVFVGLQRETEFTVPAELLVTKKIDNYYYVLNPESPIGIESIPGDTELILLFDKKLSCNVTVRFKDQDNNYFKDDEIITDLIAGSDYHASTEQKTSVYTISDNYVLSPDSPTGVEDIQGDVILTLEFIKSTLLFGTFEWAADDNSNWNERDKNFLVNSVASAYQKGNSALFNENALNTSVVITENLDLEAGDVEITGSGYDFSGAGQLNGSGKMLVSLPEKTAELSLNIESNLEEGIEVTNGTVEIKNARAATKYTMADDTKLIWNTGANFGMDTNNRITLDGDGILDLDAVTPSSYYLAVNGVETLNLTIGSSEDRGEVKSDWSGTALSSELINVNVKAAVGLDSARFATSRAHFTDKKLNLGKGVALSRNDAYGDVFTIGELSGEAGSFIDGANHTSNASNRVITYQIGGLNTDATFAGTVRQYNGNTELNEVNLEKVGSGVWTFSGNYVAAKGYVSVKEGSLVLNGSIAVDSIPFTLSEDAVLTGSGNIAGPATLAGTLDGGFKFGNNVQLTGTVNLVVTNFTDKFDVLQVNGALDAGGILNITVENTPAGNAVIQLLDVKAGVDNAFAEINLPSDDYSFNTETGELTYTDPTSGIQSQGNLPFSVYTTDHHVVISGVNAGQPYTIYNITGVIVQQGFASANKVEVPLPQGLYLVKVGEETRKVTLY